MDRFIDIRVLPDAEFAETTLMNALFSKLHRALVSATGKIGVSFPHANKTLGDVLRLHSEEKPLADLMSLDWLKGLRDYTQTSQIGWAPTTCQYRVIKRVQPKITAAQMRRLAARTGINPPTSTGDICYDRLSYPFLRLRSESTGQLFPLFIDQTTVVERPHAGSFSKYGLSAKATVPWF